MARTCRASHGPDIAYLLGQADDQGGLIRRMAMTVLINTLIFHEASQGADLRINDAVSPRRVKPLLRFRHSATARAS